MKHNVVVLLLNDNFTTNETHQMGPPRLSSVRKAGMTDTCSFGSWSCPKSSSPLRQRYRVTRQQVATADGRDAGQVRGPCYERIRITEQIRRVTTNQGQRTAWLYVNRGNVGLNQTSVKAPCNARPGQGRVGVVRHNDALPPAAGHNQVLARIQSRTVGDEDRAGVASPCLPSVLDNEPGAFYVKR